jgi:hypothetical protein
MSQLQWLQAMHNMRQEYLRLETRAVLRTMWREAENLQWLNLSPIN